MDIPSVRLFCLEQGDGSPEDHFVEYLDLSYHSHYPDFTSTQRQSCPGRDLEGALPPMWKPSQKPPSCAEQQPVPNADKGLDSAMMREPAPAGVTEWNVALEPEPRASDQMCEPAALAITEGVLVEFAGMDRLPTHPPATESTSPATINVGKVYLALMVLKPQVDNVRRRGRREKQNSQYLWS
ncbi:hypothetical protein DPX16_5316 [Anabarilius grahami]|uniref:Uncharacterized protein n=1 Tax=Anabarilius grahami TaxID=495550 RepID=A0A3N0XUS8_ANAGA|nr:hypothetical protein DPX16_5316 [Anabarilius grahami]